MAMLATTTRKNWNLGLNGKQGKHMPQLERTLKKRSEEVYVVKDAAVELCEVSVT